MVYKVTSHEVSLTTPHERYGPVSLNLPAYQTLLRYILVVSEYVLEQVLEPRSRHVYKVPIGAFYTYESSPKNRLTTSPRYLIWIGSDQEKTFGPTISGLIHRHMGPERLCLWDSKARGGRPDVMKLVKEAYAYWKAEGTVSS